MEVVELRFGNLERDLGIRFPIRRSVRVKTKKAAKKNGLEDPFKKNKYRILTIHRQKQRIEKMNVKIVDLKYRNKLLEKKIKQLEKKFGICNK